MKSFKIPAVLIAALFLLVFVPVWAVNNTALAGEAKVVIHSPEDGAVIKGSKVVVTYEIVDRGEKGDHVHIYMDGKLVKPVRGTKKSYTIKWVKKGKHTIEVILATSRHKLLDVKDAVTITVK